MNSIATGMFAAIIATAPFSCTSSDRSGQSDSEPAFVRKAKDIIEKDLSDPDSVRYRKIAFLDEGEGFTTVCGEFNAKNRVGGYVGYQTFSVSMSPDRSPWVQIAASTVTDDEYAKGLKQPLSGNPDDPIWIRRFCEE
ncbi:hypothetical protein [Achromobacter insolitus]|uniref:hypothetical protein n=1 Tax=Achromobacter insolitus TaxID=217204 RepID=UPI001EEE6637|nr:hypothetical protein [Achromobacter insolitus]